MADITQKDYVKFLTPNGWSSLINIYSFQLINEAEKLIDGASFNILTKDISQLEILTISVHVFYGEKTYMGRLKSFTTLNKMINIILKG